MLRIKIKDDGLLDEATRDVYSNDGTQQSASTIAVTYGKKMLIGSIYTTATLCDLVVE